MALLSTTVVHAGEWTYHTVSSGGLPNDVLLGNQGNAVFSSYGGVEGRTVMLNADSTDPVDPVWLEIQPNSPDHLSVASATEADVYATLTVEPDSASITGLRARLRKFSSSSQDVADWTRQLPIDIFFANSTSLAISADGQRIIAVGCTVNGTAHIYRFSPNSSNWQQVSTFSIGAPAQQMRASKDATKLYFQRGSGVMVYDLLSNQLTLNKIEFGEQFPGGHAMSGDGRTIAYALTDSVAAYRQNSSGAWTQILDLQLASNEYCSQLALSHNGNRLAAGIQNFNLQTAGLMVIDPAYGTVITERHYTGSGSLHNVASAVDLTPDGRFAGLTMWGDATHSVPEVAIFDTTSGNSTPAHEHTLPGSALSLDLSDDGSQFVVGSKTFHMNTGGFVRGRIDRVVLDDGGVIVDPPIEADFYLTDETVHGAIVTFHYRPGGNGGTTFMLVSDGLATAPMLIGGVGTLYLKRNSLTILQYSSYQAGEEVEIQYALPHQQSAIGTKLYFQGFCHGPRQLSEDFVEVTIL